MRQSGRAGFSNFTPRKTVMPARSTLADGSAETDSGITSRSTIMPTYISLVQFTDKGIQAAKQTTQRVADWAAKVQRMGVSIKQMYWTLGHYDQVCVFDAPDDETAASVLLAADLLGNIRTQTMRAFTTSEMEKILARVP
jgi:uncharacterized protein with GYD domain